MSSSSYSKYSISAVNCTSYPSLQGNPDISGIGLLVSFIATAYLTLICCISKAVLDGEKFENIHRCQRWSSALEKVIVSFSDQQLLTGISIIIGGLSQLEFGLPVYHFQAVGNLAWFSTMSHILTLTILREKVQYNQALRILRIGLMGVLVVLLICVMVPVGYINPDSFSNYNAVPLEFPAWCLYHPSTIWIGAEDGLELNRGYNWIYVAFTLVILVYGYLSRVFLIFPDVFHGLLLRTILRISPGQPWIFIESKLKSLQNRQISTAHRTIKIASRLCHRLLYSLLVLLAAGKYLYGSKTWELTWLSFALFWGTLRLFSMRNNWVNSPNGLNDNPYGIFLVSNVIAQENIWGFGQVVAVGLLPMPFISFLEEYYSFEGHLPPNHNITTSVRHNSTSSSSSQYTTIIKDLTTKQWYRKLLIVWYSMSIIIGAFALWALPADGSKSLGHLQFYLLYACVMIMNIVMLWIFVLCVIPEWKILSSKIAAAAFTIFWILVSSAMSGLLMIFLMWPDYDFAFLSTIWIILGY